jgi:hypothetical protein
LKRVGGHVVVESGLWDDEGRLQYTQTISEIFHKEEWLTAEIINRHQPRPPSNPSLPADDWKQSGRIFSVTFGGQEYFPRYQFDAIYQPLPLIRDILAAFGAVDDTWKISAWFHYPNGRIVKRVHESVKANAPKDALDRRDDLMNALNKRTGSYVA